MKLAIALRTVGELLLTAGVIVLLFLVYELKITDLQNAASQSTQRHRLQQRWQAPAAPSGPAAVVGLPAVSIGEGLAVLRIPRLGLDYDPVVVEGVSTSALRQGPGHYPGTALPGGIGNFVVSGHRTTYGHPFSDLDRLRQGDVIGVETRTTWYLYRVTGTSIVAPTDVGVILPVPEQPRATPTAALLTFTTCNPRYSAAQRLVVHAALDTTAPTDAGTPPVLMTAV